MNNFVSLDVETANHDMSSICQIGVVKYVDGVVTDEFYELIDPDDYFYFRNQDIHGISSDDVTDCRKFNQIIQELLIFIDNLPCVCHTKFDKNAINRAVVKYNLPYADINWLDSSMIARRTWEQFAYKGYGLANLCEFIGYKFNHHDALEDAKAAGQIVLKACEIKNYKIDDWVSRVNKPIFPNTYKANTKDVNIEGEFFGDNLVFTGSLKIPRREATSLASILGFNTISYVTKKTNILVVGDQDISRLAGHKKSSKHRKAESLILKKCDIRIIKESDFFAMLDK